jgi:hypothetical protein
MPFEYLILFLFDSGGPFWHILWDFREYKESNRGVLSTPFSLGLTLMSLNNSSRILLMFRVVAYFTRSCFHSFYLKMK